jgi:hypothetical protein
VSRVLTVPSLLGVLLFGGAFALSFLNPLLIERAAREVVRIEVEHRVGEKIDTLSNSRIADFAQRARGGTEADIAQTQRALRNEVPGQVATVIANMLNPGCECRERLAEYALRWESARLSSLIEVRERLAALIESAYASVTSSLMREFRIFTASNAIAFALLGFVSLVRGRATLQLCLPAVVLVGAVTVTGGLYLFNQNWLHTIVFGQYVGLAYATYLACVALLLADVLMNRARVTTRLVNVALHTVGSAAPC